MQMKYTDNALNILTAKTYKGIGPAWLFDNIQKSDCWEVIVEKISKKDSLASEQDFVRRKKEIERQILMLGENCDGITSFVDADFPHIHGNVKTSQKPPVLFYKGDLSLLSGSDISVAVIGLLEPDMQTDQDERMIVDYLVRNNIIIVSGLANGCDAIAHHQTLVSGGRTVAILPSPLNNIQPSNNTPLAIDIVNNGGLVITEYFTPPQGQRELISRYIERDRLQALFSRCVILSASYAQNNLGNDSGSRHALGKAKEYGLGRCVVYNYHHPYYTQNPKYDLNRQIIEEDKHSAMVIDPQSMQVGLNTLLNYLSNSTNKQGNEASIQDSLF